MNTMKALACLLLCCSTATATGVHLPHTFMDTHEVCTPEQADEARVLEVLFRYAPHLLVPTVEIGCVHLHEDRAGVYLSTDGGDTYTTWLVDMEQAGW